MTDNKFDILVLIARPAAGKSEIIDYLKNTPLPQRLSRFHVGEFEEIDDFPTLWRWFEEDRVLTEMGLPRLHSDQDEFFLHQHQWNVLIRMICLDYQKKIQANPTYHDTNTAIIEFSRGSQHGGYQEAFQHIDPEMAKRMAVLYLNVTWAESRRKDAKRYNPDDAGSILEHSVGSKIEKLYKEIDWEEVSAPSPTHLNIAGIQVPYVVMENEDDVTTARGDALGDRLEQSLQTLWKNYK
jgi:hypothetical protein